MIFGALGSGNGDFLSGIRALIKECLLLWRHDPAGNRIAMWKNARCIVQYGGKRPEFEEPGQVSSIPLQPDPR